MPVPSTSRRSSFIARLAKIVRTQKLVNRGDHIIVAVSGGPDSVALLSVLHRLAPTFALSLSAVHFNYGLRGMESDEDAVFVDDLCQRLGISYVCEPLRLTKSQRQGRSLQEAARDARYDALLRLRAVMGAQTVALGHTADDQAETIILRLLRGSGTTGLSGMAAVRLPFIRPLLTVRRHDILAYLHEENIAFREDSSNAKPIYLRNRVRHELLPHLQQFKPGLVEVLTRQADIFREDDECLEDLTRQHFVRLAHTFSGGTCLLNRQELLGLPLALQRRILRKAVQHGSGQARGPSAVAVATIVSQVLHGHSGVSVMVGRVQVGREFNLIRFQPTRERQTTATYPVMELPVPSTVAWPPTGQILRAEALTSIPPTLSTRSLPPTQVVLDADRVPADLQVRSWLPGDCFHPYGLNGHKKKLQDFFIDAKVPKSMRTCIPLVVALEGIVWVAGYRMDHRFRIMTATTRLVRLTLTDGGGRESRHG